MKTARNEDDLGRLGDLVENIERAVANKIIGQLYGCLKSGTLYNEGIAWRMLETTETAKAA